MANPTTNFGWVMPTSSSLVTNLPADFNTFGQAVDTSMSELLGGTTGQVLSKTSATNMDFTWVTPTDQTPLTTKGDLFTFSTVDARLGVGTNGQTLVADSTASTGLKWATPAGGGGKLLQVVTATASTAYTNATTTFTDVTGLTATITPTSATSRILVVISATVGASASAGLAYVGARLLRGGTSIVSYQSYGFIYSNAPGGLQQATIQYMDSPATTSATTYKLQASIDTAANSMTATFQYINNPSVITLFEIGA